MGGLDDETLVLKREMEEMNKLNLDKVNNLIERVSLSENEYKSFKEFKLQKEKEKQLQAAIETAIKTMRKTECWGCNCKALNFEWPTAQDLLQMLKSAPVIKVADLKYKGDSWFRGF